MKTRYIQFTPETAKRVVEGKPKFLESARQYLAQLFTPTLDGQ